MHPPAAGFGTARRHEAAFDVEPFLQYRLARWRNRSSARRGSQIEERDLRIPHNWG
jgi:hypothetical protein